MRRYGAGTEATAELLPCLIRFPDSSFTRFLLVLESSNRLLASAVLKSQIAAYKSLNLMHTPSMRNDSIMTSVLSLRISLRALAAVAFATAAVPCAAQLRLDVVPDTTVPPMHRNLDLGTAHTTVPSASMFSGSATSTSSWLGSAIQLETPRATSTGQYTRPKFHVGVPSESMRGFLNSAGFAAEKCQLPMIRARTKSNGDGDIDGTLWLYARCTFR